jgi:glycosyltransferase involved in cell wall biosynthesis
MTSSVGVDATGATVPSRPTVPTFTVVVPAYNASSGLPPTLDAVLAQKEVDLEVIVVDDGSTDDTAAVAAAVDDPRVRVIRQPNRGVSSARNAGLAAAAGRWVAFLDCDDLPEPNWLTTFVELLDQPGVVVAYVGATYRTADGRPTAIKLPHDHGPAFHGLRALLLAGTMGARVDFLRELGGFCDGLTYSENTELGLRVGEALHRRGLRADSTTDSVLTLFDPGGQISRAYTSQARLDAAAYIVARHHHRLHEDPHLLGTYYSMMGVSAARLRKAGSAAYFARAVLANPGRLRHYGQLLVSLVPALRNRAWAPDGQIGPRTGRRL